MSCGEAWGEVNLHLLPRSLIKFLNVVNGAILEHEAVSTSAVLGSGAFLGRLGRASSAAALEGWAVAGPREGTAGEAHGAAAIGGLRLRYAVAVATVVATAPDIPVGGDGSAGYGRESVAAAATAAGIGVGVGASSITAIAVTVGVKAEVNGRGCSCEGKEEGLSGEHVGQCSRLVRREGFGVWRDGKCC